MNFGNLRDYAPVETPEAAAIAAFLRYNSWESFHYHNRDGLTYAGWCPEFVYFTPLSRATPVAIHTAHNAPDEEALALCPMPVIAAFSRPSGSYFGLDSRDDATGVVTASMHVTRYEAGYLNFPLDFIIERDAGVDVATTGAASNLPCSELTKRVLNVLWTGALRNAEEDYGCKFPDHLYPPV